MPWLRYRHFKSCTPLTPHVDRVSSGRIYKCFGGDGAVFVPYAADAVDLLNPPGDEPSAWELAYEKYKIAFDSTGKEIVPEPVSPVSLAAQVQHAQEAIRFQRVPQDEKPKPKLGRPPKR